MVMYYYRMKLFLGSNRAFVFLLLLLLQAFNARSSITQVCSSSCGNIHNITNPFRLSSDPENCGDHSYQLYCEKNATVLYLYSGRFYVQAINYHNFTIRLVDAGLSSENCSSLPNFPLSYDNFSSRYPYSMYRYERAEPNGLNQILTFIKCAHPGNSSLYLDTAPCINGSQSKMHSYVDVAGLNASDLMEFCSVEMVTATFMPGDASMSFLEIHRRLVYGFELQWYNYQCKRCEYGCYANNKNKPICYSVGIGLRETVEEILEGISYLVISFLVFVHGPTMICGTPCVIAFLTYKWRRRHLSSYIPVEEFLQGHNDLTPARYSYSDIKKMTKGFKDKLGEGGFGSVYKGKLRSGHFAAIKMLRESKANCQDFISEVATIGRIHHTNVVQLIGYCSEGSKRALVYSFMPNGSLDKHIFQREGATNLSWEKLLEISLGVARGIEYLHQGCDMQILHFDIKPHNILLDENFIPKISDFGLAKTYPTNNSIVSLTAARGTIGYMAPELFYKNIGRVSFKADVYSFGMLLLEIAGKKRNLNISGENSSEVYFPECVYKQVSKGKAIQAGGVVEEEEKIVEKIVITGLWCIQMNPIDRPAMNKVVEMLEGEVERLQLPPKCAPLPEVTTIIKDTEESSSADSTDSVSSISDE